MAGRQSKLRIESLMELKQTFAENAGAGFGLLVRGERKVEMEIDDKVIDELQRMQKWSAIAAATTIDPLAA